MSEYKTEVHRRINVMKDRIKNKELTGGPTDEANLDALDLILKLMTEEDQKNFEYTLAELSNVYDDLKERESFWDN